MSRQFEARCGSLSSLLTISAALAAAWLAATSARTLLYLGLVALAGLVTAAGANLHARHPGGATLALLWVGAMALVALTVAAMFSVGLLLLPGAVLAVIAAIVGAREQAAHVSGGQGRQPLA